MTDIEIEIIDFKNNLDTRAKEVDVIFRNFIYASTNGEWEVKYTFEEDVMRVEFSNGTDFTCTKYMDPHIALYTIGAILASFKQKECVAEITEMLNKGLDMCNIFMYYHTILLDQLIKLSVDWKILDKI